MGHGQGQGLAAALEASPLGRRLGLRAGGPESAVKARSILRRGDVRRQPGGAAHRKVQWRGVLVGVDEEDADAVRAQMHARAQFEARIARYYKLLRLPTLTYEEFAIPLRCAFPVGFARLALPIVLDAAVDLFELACIAHAVRREFREHAAQRVMRATAAASVPNAPRTADAGDGESAPYTLERLIVDLVTVFALAAGRTTQARTGLLWPWYGAQVFRCIRLRDLSDYMAHLNADLTTNVTVFAIFKFTLVLMSVPHWVGCMWWALSASPDRNGLQLPSWTAQYEMLVGVPGLFEPTQTSGVRAYMMAQYMAWSGVASMGYGSITLVMQSEIWFGSSMIIVQIVFYACAPQRHTAPPFARRSTVSRYARARDNDAPAPAPFRATRRRVLLQTCSARSSTTSCARTSEPSASTSSSRPSRSTRRAAGCRQRLGAR